MKLLCTWCGIDIDCPAYNDRIDPNTSHDMCPACSASLACQERGVPLEDYLDTIPIPVLLIDDNNFLVTMNTQARTTLRKEPDEARTPLSEKIFDCVFSRCSEGCGRRVHCSGCVIRRNVTATFDSGEARVSVPAALCTTSPDQLSEAVLNVTTSKIGGMVLLRLEWASSQA